MLHRVAKARNPEIFTASAVLLVLGAAVLMEHVGLSMAMGAFLAGLLIADSAFRHQVMAETQPFRGLLLGLFFMSMGMTLDLGQLLDQPLVLLGLAAALMLLKAALIWPLARLFGLGGKSALTAALLLAQSGEFALVLFTVALGVGLLDQDLFQRLLVVVILTMLATPFLAGLARKVRRAERAPPAAAPEPADEGHGPAPVLVVGYGRVGRKIGRVLEAAGVAYSAIDRDPALVAREHARSRAVFFGDAERPAVLKALGAEGARMAVIALDDEEVTEGLVTTLRENFPDLSILARGQNRERCQRLRSLGADAVVSETLETSLELARVVLAKAGTPDEEANRLVEDYRRDYRDRHELTEEQQEPGG